MIHLAVDGAYAGHILIADVVKPTAKAAMEALRGAGVEKTVMLTGDVRTVAQQVAEELGVDQVYSELLPGDKVAKVEEMLQQKPAKKKLAFVGMASTTPRFSPGRISALPWGPWGRTRPLRPPMWF